MRKTLSKAFTKKVHFLLNSLSLSVSLSPSLSLSMVKLSMIKLAIDY